MNKIALQHAFLLLSILFISLMLKAQKTTHSRMLWFGYNNSMKLSEVWSLQSDLQIRGKDWARQWTQLAVRTSAIYKINDRLKVAAGFCLFKHVQYINEDPVFKNEWRPFQDILHLTKFSKNLQFNQRIRSEERFLQEVKNNKKTDSYKYVFRFRYRFEFEKGFSSKWKGSLGNEILVNPGYIEGRYFWDQNRSFAGIQYRINPSFSVQLQYIKIFQWKILPASVENSDVIRVNIFQELRKR